MDLKTGIKIAEEELRAEELSAATHKSKTGELRVAYKRNVVVWLKHLEKIMIEELKQAHTRSQPSA